MKLKTITGNSLWFKQVQLIDFVTVKPTFVDAVPGNLF